MKLLSFLRGVPKVMYKKNWEFLTIPGHRNLIIQVNIGSENSNGAFCGSNSQGIRQASPAFEVHPTHPIPHPRRCTAPSRDIPLVSTNWQAFQTEPTRKVAESAYQLVMSTVSMEHERLLECIQCPWGPQLRGFGSDIRPLNCRM